MKRLVVIVVVVCAVALTAILLITRSNETEIEKSVIFKLEKTYGVETEPKEAMLSGVYKMETDINDNLYIVDRNERLVSFSPDGSFRWQVNKKGKGPGDIENPRGMTIDGEKYLYLANINGTRIDKYDFEGNYLRSLPASDIKQDYISLVGFIKPNLMILSKALWGKIGSEVFIYDVNNNFELKNHFAIDQTGSFKLPPSSSLGFGIGISDNKIAAGNLKEYKLSLYGTDGKEEKIIKRNVKNLFLAFASENMSGISGSISIPYKIKGNYYLVSMNAPVNVTEMSQLLNREFKRVYETTIDIFNAEGSRVYTKKYAGRTDPELGRPIYSDSEGFLYTYKELPYPQICKYRVIISDKK